MSPRYGRGKSAARGAPFFRIEPAAHSGRRHDGNRLPDGSVSSAGAASGAMTVKRSSRAVPSGAGGAPALCHVFAPRWWW